MSAICMNSYQTTRITQFKNATLGLVSRLLGRDFVNYRKSIWLTVINEIFKFQPHFETFDQVNYLYEHSSGYQHYPIQIWYIWASFQNSRKGFRKLQESYMTNCN